ncbi:MAG: PKD domain-containing protein, partial [Ginsengibacter sp.]
MRKLICTLTAFFILSVAFTQTITPLGNITFCEGGGVMLTVSSDTSITAYQWMKDGTAIPNEISVNYTATALGNYTVRVKRDTLFDTIGPVKVTVYPKPTVNVNSPSVCVGETTTLIATGANTYAWSPSTALSSTTGATVTTNTNVTTTYRVIGMNSSGCLDTAFATVTVNQKPITDFTFTDNACSGANVAFTPTASGGTPGYTYSWDFGDGVISTNPSHIFTSLGCS